MINTRQEAIEIHKVYLRAEILAYHADKKYTAGVPCAVQTFGVSLHLLPITSTNRTFGSTIEHLEDISY